MPVEPKLILTPLPPEALVWNQFMSVLRGAPGLKSVATKIVTYEDGPDELPINKPVPDAGEMPYVRVLCAKLATKKKSVAFYLGTVTASMELFTSGCHQTDMFILGHLVRAAWQPTDEGQRAAIRNVNDQIEAGADSIRYTAGIQPVGQAPHALKSMVELIARVQVRVAP